MPAITEQPETIESDTETVPETDGGNQNGPHERTDLVGLLAA
ncbi:hypothetical protein ACWF94_40145 [Streptomyces sp. NPDC055078]